MAGLKDFTVRRLRELARKHLGAGHTKLRTKEQLIAALKKIVFGLVTERPRPAAKAKKDAPEKRGRGAATRKRSGKKPLSTEPAREAPRIAPKAVPRAADGGARTPKVEIFRFEKRPAPAIERVEDHSAHRQASGMLTEAPRIAAPEGDGQGRHPGATGMTFGRAPIAAAPSAEVTATPERAERSRPLPTEPPVPAPVDIPQRGDGGHAGRGVAAEPLVEGFFVARVAGVLEARRHHLTEDQVPPPSEHGVGLHYHEQLPPIPSEYQDDRVVLLGRDPWTAWAYWDFHPETRRAAFEGLKEPRAVLRVLESGQEVRAIDLALESRSFYVHGLPAGRRYRMELHAVGSDGTSRRIGPPSNDVVLPPDDVSPDTTVRLMRVPWDVPLNRLRESLRKGIAAIHTPAEPPEPLAIMHSRWVPLANSGSWQLQTWLEGAGAQSGGLPSGWMGVSSRAASPDSTSWALPPPRDRGER
jgi:hypothetical protein